MRALDYKSVSTVAIHIDNLITKGHLRKRDKSARSLEVIRPLTATSGQKTVTKSEEKWLVELIEARLRDFETNPSDKKRDDLFVLVGALHVLGLDAAAMAYKSRLPRD